MAQPAEPISGIPSSNVSNVPTDGEVAAGSTAEFTHTLTREGTVKRIYAMSYAGHETDVEYHCELIPDGSGQEINLLAQATDDSLEYLIGDDQQWDFPLRREFSMDDEIRFRYVNNDANNNHNVHMRVHVDYDTELIERFGNGGFF